MHLGPAPFSKTRLCNSGEMENQLPTLATRPGFSTLPTDAFKTPVNPEPPV
jgi:hypothetical protein